MESRPDCDRYDTLHQFLIETGRTPQRTPIPWGELEVPPHLKNRQDPGEVEASRVRKPPPYVNSKQRRQPKLKPLSKEDLAQVKRIEDYFSMKDLARTTDGATPEK